MVMRAKWRHIVGLGALGLLVVGAMLLPTMAFAAVGDSQDTALALPALPWATSLAGTLQSVIDPYDGKTYHEFWYTIPLAAGQTVSVTATSDPSVSSPGLEMWPVSFDTPYYVEATYPSDSVSTLTMMAPRAGDYFISAYGGDTDTTFTLSAQSIPAVNFSLWGFSAPKTAKRSKAFAVSVKMSPKYNGLFPPVKIYVQHKVGKKWKAYKTYTGLSNANGTAFSAKPKLAKGVYRSRAAFWDAAHPHAKYTAWKTVTVK